MIRLYLNAYRPAELSELYDALHTACTTLVHTSKSHPVSDLEEALAYLAGYIDAKGDSVK